MIRDVFVEGNWQLDLIYSFLLERIKDQIRAMQPRLVENVADSWRWSKCVTGIYSTKSAYHTLLDSFHGVTKTNNLAWNWKINVSSNLQFFMWWIWWGSLPTRSILTARHINTTSMCPICNETDETMCHCLVSCPVVAKCGIHAFKCV